MVATGAPMIVDEDVWAKNWGELIEWMADQPPDIIIWWDWLFCCADIAQA